MASKYDVLGAPKTHDTYFKAWWSDPVRAGQVCRCMMAPRLSSQLTDDPPVLEPTSMADADLSASEMDALLLFRRHSGRWLRLVVEHKAGDSSKVAGQLCRYESLALDIPPPTGPDGKPEPFDVMGAVLYHGRRKRWTPPHALPTGDGQDPEPADGIFRFPVWSLMALDLDDTPLVGEAWAGAATLVGAFDRKVREDPTMLPRIVAAVIDNPIFRAQTVSYLMARWGVAKAALDAIMEKLRPGEDIMDQTYEQMAKAQWEGGEAKGKAGLLTRLLNQKFGTVPKRRQRQLDQASPDELDSWGGRLLDASTLEAVFRR